MNNKLKEICDISLDIIKMFPKNLDTVQVIKDPESFLYIADNSDDFYKFFMKSTTKAISLEKIKKEFDEEKLKSLGINIKEYQNIIDEIIEKDTDSITETINLITNTFGNEETAKKMLCGAYNKDTKQICLNPMYENNENYKELYLWTIFHELGHAVHFELFDDEYSSLNSFLNNYKLSELLPSRAFIKGMDPIDIKNIIYKKTGKNISIKESISISKIKLEEKIPTEYSTIAPQEFWAEAFALFIIDNKTAKVVTPHTYALIKNEIFEGK